jgi:hypothetical protein
LLPRGGQRQFAGPQAQRGIGAVAVVGRAGADLHRGFLQRQRQQADRGEFLAAGLAGVVPLAGRDVLGDAAQPGEPFGGVGDQPGLPVAEKLATVLKRVGAAIDAMGGSFTMPYTTVAVTAARTTPA